MEEQSLEEQAIMSLLSFAESNPPLPVHFTPTTPLKQVRMHQGRSSLPQVSQEQAHPTRTINPSHSSHLSTPKQPTRPPVRQKLKLKGLLEKLTEINYPTPQRTPSQYRSSIKTVKSEANTRYSAQKVCESSQRGHQTLECVTANRQLMKELVQAKIAQKMKTNRDKKALLKTKLHLSTRAAAIRKLRNISQGETKVRTTTTGKENSRDSSMTAAKVRLKELVI